MPDLQINLPDDVSAWLSRRAIDAETSAKAVAASLILEAFDRAALSPEEQQAIRCFAAGGGTADGWVPINILYGQWQRQMPNASRAAFNRTFDSLVEKAFVRGSDASGSAFRLLLRGLRVKEGL